MYQWNEFQQETDMFVYSIIENISISDKRLEEIKKKNITDKICSQVINFYKMVLWPEATTQDPELRFY